MAAIGQDDAIAHEDYSQGGCRTRIGQAEHQLPLGGLHVENLLCGEGGQPFARTAHTYHHGCHEEGGGMLHEGHHIDEHAHTNQEIGNKKRVAHKLNMIHQGRGGRDAAVEHDTRKECAEDAFHTHKLHQAGTQEYKYEYEDVLHNAVVIAAEKPTRQARENQNDKCAQHRHTAQQPYPFIGPYVLLEQTANNGQHEQGQCVGHNRAAHGNAHALTARQTITQHDGIGHQRMAGIHGRHQYGCGNAVAQEGGVGCETYEHREGKAEQTQRQSAALYLLDVLHVHLQRGEEHDIVEAYLAKEFKTSIAVEDMKAVRTYQHARKNHSHNRGDAQPFEQHRRKEDDAQDDKENPCRVGDGQIGHRECVL